MALELAFKDVALIAGSIDLLRGVDMKSAEEYEQFPKVVLTLELECLLAYLHELLYTSFLCNSLSLFCVILRLLLRHLRVEALILLLNKSILILSKCSCLILAEGKGPLAEGLLRVHPELRLVVLLEGLRERSLLLLCLVKH
jgi:hypothetical protein